MYRNIIRKGFFSQYCQIWPCYVYAKKKKKKKPRRKLIQNAYGHYNSAVTRDIRIFATRARVCGAGEKLFFQKLGRVRISRNQKTFTYQNHRTTSVGIFEELFYWVKLD